MVRVAGLEPTVSWSQTAARTWCYRWEKGCSNLVLQMGEAHLPVFAPFSMVSGGVVHTVSGCPGGRCGQRCGPYRELPWSGPKAAPREHLYRNSDGQKSQVILSSQAAARGLRLAVKICDAVDKD